MTTLERHLERNAALHPGRAALNCGGLTLSYGRLWDSVCIRAGQMSDALEKALVIKAKKTPGFVIDYLAAHLAGIPVVPLEADIPAEAQAAISGKVLRSGIPAEVADILFTTGTTGDRKGVMISHRAILADAENLAEAQGFGPDLNFIINGPLNHIGSLSKIWPTLLTGGTITVLEGMKDLDGFFRTVHESEHKSATFLVPASISILLRFCRKQLQETADRFDFIETGAAPMAQPDMEALCSLLPHTRLYNTYASTETGIICTHDYNAGPCVAGCLGRTMKHSSLTIGDDGLISCSGATVMTGYLGDEEATARILRNGVVYTSDRGRLDSDGRLHLTGREGDVINTGGYKVNPVEVEDAARAFPGIADCICIAGEHPVLGTVLQLLVVTEGDAPLDRKALGRFLLGRLESHKVPQMLTKVDAIHRTYNGKLDRKYYKTP